MLFTVLLWATNAVVPSNASACNDVRTTKNQHIIIIFLFVVMLLLFVFFYYYYDDDVG